MLAAFSVLMSEAPAWFALPAAACSAGWGAWRARVEANRAPVALCIDDEGGATLDGAPLTRYALHWRGPLAFLHWRAEDGRRGCLVATPDVLDSPARRRLRLAIADRPNARPVHSVAP